MNKKTTETVPLSVGEQFLYESIVSLMGRLFLPDNMNSYACCYDILGRIDLKGRRVSADLRRLCEERNISIEKKRLEMFLMLESDVHMRKKWESYMLASGKDKSLEWDKVFGRVKSFISPLWSAMCEDGFYLCDWIGELGRYMD